MPLIVTFIHKSNRLILHETAKSFSYHYELTLLKVSPSAGLTI